MNKLIEAITSSDPIVRDYIHELETDIPSYNIQKIFMLRQQRDALILILKEKQMGGWHVFKYF